MKEKFLPFLKVSFLAVLMMGFVALNAQTTLNTTVGSTGYTGSNSAGTGLAITFVIENTTSSPILLTEVGDWTSTADNNATFTLYYSSTSLSGAPPH